MPDYTPIVRLLERDHPLEVLQTRALRAAAGGGCLVVLAGEAGIGKTVMLRAFAEQAPIPVLWGMCDPLSTPRPLGPLRDVAGALGPTVTTSLSGSAAQHEIFAAVLEALRATPRAPIVEDLHWADEATTDLVRFLARRIGALPLLMIVSYRDTGGADPRLSPVLGDLVSTPGARRIGSRGDVRTRPPKIRMAGQRASSPRPHAGATRAQSRSHSRALRAAVTRRTPNQMPTSTARPTTTATTPAPTPTTTASPADTGAATTAPDRSTHTGTDAPALVPAPASTIPLCTFPAASRHAAAAGIPSVVGFAAWTDGASSVSTATTAVRSAASTRARSSVPP